MNQNETTTYYMNSTKPRKLQDFTFFKIANSLGLTPRAVKNLCRHGYLRGAYKLKGEWYIPREENRKFYLMRVWIITQCEKICQPLDLYSKYEPLAQNIKVTAQMWIGAFIVISLVMKVIVEFLGLPDWGILEKKPLEIIAFWLAISAGFELAYMLYTKGPDEAVQPLMLGLTSATLLVVSGVDFNNSNWGLAATVSAFVLGIGFLFWVRERFDLKE